MNNNMHNIIQTHGNMLSRYDASEHHSSGTDEKFPITVRSLFAHTIAERNIRSDVSIRY